MPSLRQLTNLTQVAVLVAFVGLLVLLHFRNREDRQHALKMHAIDELRRDAQLQQQQAEELVVRAEKRLADAERWQPAWIKEPEEKPENKSAEKPEESQPQPARP